MAHIHVKNAHAEGEGIDGFRVLQVFVQFYDGLGAAVGEQAVQAVVGVIVYDIVYALEIFLLHHLLFLKVVHLKAAHLGIVGGVNKAVAIAVQSHKGRVIKLNAVDVAKPALLAGIQVNFCEVGKAARGVHGGVGLARCRVVHKGRDRTQRLFGERGSLRYRVFPDGGQIGFLVLFLVFFPLVPGFPERLSVYFLELVSKERTAVGRAIVETDHLVVSVFLGEVVHEASAVEIGIGAHLEVHGRAFRFQTHHREQLVSSADDAAEVHLIVTAQSAAHASSQPGFHKAGNTFVVPAGRIPAGNAEIAPEGRYGMGIVCSHLCAEELAPAQVPLVVLVCHHNVRVLVLEQLTVPLTGRIHIVRHVQRSHANLNKGTRQRRCSAVAVVFPVCE